MSRFLPFLICILMTTLANAQSPWVQAKGDQYHQLSFTGIPKYSELFSSSGSIQLPREISDNTLQYYGEFGLGHRLTISANLPFKLLSTGAIADSSAIALPGEGSFKALGDIEVSAKRELLSINNIRLSALVNVAFPTSSFQAETGLRSGFNVFKVEPGLSLGYSNAAFYTYAFGTFGWYDQAFSNRIYLGAEVGFHFTDQIILAAFISSFQALDEPVLIPTSASALFESTQEYTAVTLKIIAEIIPDKMGFLLTFGGGSGHLVAKSPAISIGLFLR